MEGKLKDFYIREEVLIAANHKIDTFIQSVDALRTHF